MDLRQKFIRLNSNKGTKSLTGFFATFSAQKTFGKSAAPKIGSCLVDNFGGLMPISGSSSGWRRLLLRGEEFFERGAHFGNVDGRDLPHDVQIHVRVIVCHDVAHAAHLAER
jgi:hypothetical protein